MARKYIKKKSKKGKKTFVELGMKKFERILRNKIKELNKTLTFKYDWKMCICEIGIGNTTRINARGIKLGTNMYFLLFMDSRLPTKLGTIFIDLIPFYYRKSFIYHPDLDHTVSVTNL